MKFVSVLAAGAIAAAASTALGAFTITDGNATFSSTLTPFLPDSTLSTADFRPDGGANTDHLFYYNWSYRTAIQGNRGFSAFDTPLQIVSGNTVTFTYTNAGPGAAGQNRFDAVLTIKITDGATPNAARLESTLVFRASAGNTGPTTWDIFHGADFDVGGTAAGDAYVVSSPLGVIGSATDGANVMNFTGIAANGFEVNSGALLRAKLTGGGLNNLNNNAAFTGDGAVAYQWSLGPLAPGQSVTLKSCFALNMPACQCFGDINNDGTIGTADLTALLGNFGTAVPPNTGGDLNGDGFVGTADLTALLGAFGTNC